MNISSNTYMTFSIFDNRYKHINNLEDYLVSKIYDNHDL